MGHQVALSEKKRTCDHNYPNTKRYCLNCRNTRKRTMHYFLNAIPQRATTPTRSNIANKNAYNYFAQCNVATKMSILLIWMVACVWLHTHLIYTNCTIIEHAATLQKKNNKHLGTISHIHTHTHTIRSN